MLNLSIEAAKNSPKKNLTAEFHAVVAPKLRQENILNFGGRLGSEFVIFVKNLHRFTKCSPNSIEFQYHTEPKDRDRNSLSRPHAHL